MIVIKLQKIIADLALILKVIFHIIFENCEIREVYKKYNIEMKKVIFIYTNYYLFNKLTFNGCEIDMLDKSFLNGYKMEDESGSFGVFNNCIFKTSYKNKILLFDTSLNMTFNNCNFYISRYKLSIKHNNISTFNDCYFKSTLTVKISTEKIINPSIEAPIIINIM